MSRDLDTLLTEQIDAASLQPIILAEFLFDSGALRFWNGIGTLNVLGEDFTGAGNLLGISEYTETEKLEAIGLTFQLTGIPSSLISIALTEPYQGRVCNLYFSAITSLSEYALLTESGETLLTESGEELLTEDASVICPPYLQFSGLMDIMQIESGGGTCTISVTAESKMIIINRTKERRYTAEDQKALYPSDTGLRFVTQIQDRQVIWGGGGV